MFTVFKLREHVFRVKRNQSGPSKSSPDVFFCHSCLKGGIKGWKELGLGNVGYRASDQMLDFSAIRLLKHGKAPDGKRLK
jgi:hypothetical protein